MQYSYDDRSIVVVNDRTAPARGLTARATLFDPDGTRRYDENADGVSVNGGGAHATALTLPAPVDGPRAPGCCGWC
ncbi:hypothetical protein ACFQ3Z_06350 [Streptomyces nogalater]